MKHWTEPSGNFIMNIPVEWQYKNVVFEHLEEKSPYSFEPYKNSLGCFQISCYPLADKGINPELALQTANSQLDWLPLRKDDKEFEMIFFYAQAEDLLLIAKFISDVNPKDKKGVIKQFEQAKYVLNSVRVIPQNERGLASNLNKYDNFIGSLIGSHDLLNKAYESNSHIELVAILSNHVDAYLRLSIILHQQLESQNNEIEIKYLFQEENERGIIERKIYDKAFELKIIDEVILQELNNLYNVRNRVIHRYIISHLKTRDIVRAAYEYTMLCEKIRLILKSYEDKQIGLGFGIYGKGFERVPEFDEMDYKRAYALANDKHLLGNLERIL